MIYTPKTLLLSPPIAETALLLRLWGLEVTVFEAQGIGSGLAWAWRLQGFALLAFGAPSFRGLGASFPETPISLNSGLYLQL